MGVDIVANNLGERTTPTMIGFDGEITVRTNLHPLCTYSSMILRSRHYCLLQGFGIGRVCLLLLAAAKQNVGQGQVRKPQNKIKAFYSVLGKK